MTKMSRVQRRNGEIFLDDIHKKKVFSCFGHLIGSVTRSFWDTWIDLNVLTDGATRHSRVMASAVFITRELIVHTWLEKYFTYHVFTKIIMGFVYLYRVIFLVWLRARLISGATTLPVGKVNKPWLSTKRNWYGADIPLIYKISHVLWKHWVTDCSLGYVGGLGRRPQHPSASYVTSAANSHLPFQMRNILLRTCRVY